MKNLIFAVVFLLITSAFVTIKIVETKKVNVNVEKNSVTNTKGKKSLYKWRAWATLQLQSDKGERTIEGKSGCKMVGDKGGYDYEIEAKDAAKENAESKIKAGEKEIKCTFKTQQDCSSED